MKSEHIEQALRILSERRIAAQADYQARFQTIQTAIPEIGEINQQLSQASLSIMQIIQSGQQVQEKIAKLQAQNQAAQQMVHRLLIQYGYPDDYLEPHYTCPKCQDTGYSNGTYCSCLTTLAAQLAAKELNQNARLNLSQFDTFSLEYYRGRKTENGNDCYQAMEKVLHYCMQYAATFSPQSKSILMYGKTGLGKTHLSLSIATMALQMGYQVLYDSTINFLHQVEREHFGKSDSDEQDTLERLMTCDLLILDDLGTEFNSTFYQATIYNIINTRMNRGLPVIINTNLDYNGIANRYEERIASRIYSAYTCLHFVGIDVRLLRAQEEKRKSTNSKI